MANLIRNRIICPDGTILESKHVHDFVSHIDTITGEEYFVDGGHEYERRSVNKIPALDASIYDDAPFEIIRDNLMRGTFDNQKNRIYKKLSEMSDSHVLACIVYNDAKGFGTSYVNDLYKKELDYRKENNIKIEDK